MFKLKSFQQLFVISIVFILYSCNTDKQSKYNIDREGVKYDYTDDWGHCLDLASLETLEVKELFGESLWKNLELNQENPPTIRKKYIKALYKYSYMISYNQEGKTIPNGIIVNISMNHLRPSDKQLRAKKHILKEIKAAESETFNKTYPKGYLVNLGYENEVKARFTFENMLVVNPCPTQIIEIIAVEKDKIKREKQVKLIAKKLINTLGQ